MGELHGGMSQFHMFQQFFFWGAGGRGENKFIKYERKWKKVTKRTPKGKNRNKRIYGKLRNKGPGSCGWNKGRPQRGLGAEKRGDYHREIWFRYILYHISYPNITC